MEVSEAEEIIVSGHESAHAVAAVKLGLSFCYVTLDDANIGSHVGGLDNLPRPIGFYRGGCCGPNPPMCERCRREKKRAESHIVVLICGSLGAAEFHRLMASPENLGVDFARYSAIGFGNSGDKDIVERFCRTAFGDQTYACVNVRIKTMLERAEELLRQEVETTVTAVAKALRTRRRLTETEVKEIMRKS